MSEPKTKECVLTSRSRVISYGSTCQPEQTPSGLTVREPSIARTGLTPAMFAREYRRDKQVYGGAASRCVVLVEGHRLVSGLEELLYLGDGYGRKAHVVVALEEEEVVS